MQVPQVRGDDPDRDTPRSRGRYTDDGDDRIFRQATDDEQGRVARPDSGSESGFGRGHLDFISMAMNMARPHMDDLEAMLPTRPPRPLVPGRGQAARTGDHGFGSERYLGSINRFSKSRSV